MFQVKLVLLCIGLIFGGLFSACSFFGTSTKKTAPDELYLVSKNKRDGFNNSVTVTSSNNTVGFMDKTGKIVVGPWKTFEWNGKKYGADEKTHFVILPFIEGMAGICLYEEAQIRDDNGKCGFIEKRAKSLSSRSINKSVISAKI